jgi:hypothetical protein
MVLEPGPLNSETIGLPAQILGGQADCFVAALVASCGV